MKLPIVDTTGYADIVAPGSVAVAIPATLQGNAGIWVYYEGGVYTRHPDMPPTHAQRVQYALSAAGRASNNYPTIARFFIAAGSVLAQIGEVDTDTWTVTFDEWRP